MCGICGIYGQVDRQLLVKMCDTIAHRGPDDQGYYVDKNIGLGHRRLSIIDIGGGHQPMHNEDGSIWVVFNGEIYNYREIKGDLERNHRFSTNSDTEVIIHSYEEYGLDFVKRMNGMFAFALWDSNRERLVLARDPMGKKPLYYCWHDNSLYFASEIKAILKNGMLRETDANALCGFLSYGYTIGENTLFKGVRKLPGGHLLVVEKGKAEKMQYWDIHERIVDDTEDNIISKLKSLLEQSVRYRMIADVPIGAFVSGGVDSCTVVALSRPHIDYDYHTFCAGFETFSEFKYAKIVSDHYDTVHHEIMIDCSSVCKAIDRIAWHNDEPMGDPAIINNYFLSREARKYVKVVLAGEAGDEIFGGYPNYRLNVLHSYFKIPGMSAVVRGLLDAFPGKGNIYRNNVERYARYLAQPDTDRAHLYTYKTIDMNPDEIRYISRLDPAGVDQAAVYPSKVANPLNRMLAIDCKNLLPEKFLMKADKGTMANSVEERLPLIDKNIVEFAFTVPPRLKLKGGTGKYILKRAVKDYIPREIIERKKQGFNTTVSDWIRNGEMKGLVVNELETNRIIKTYFRDEKIRKIVDHVEHGDLRRWEVVWLLYTLCLWNNAYSVDVG